MLDGTSQLVCLSPDKVCVRLLFYSELVIVLDLVQGFLLF